MKNKNQVVFFVDPMGYGSLGDYDSSILNNIKNQNIEFYGNIKFQDDKLIDKKCLKIYSYSDKKHLFKLLSYLKSQFSLLIQAQVKKPYLIHFQWFKIPRLDLILLRLLKAKGVKIVMTAHNILPHDSGSNYKKIYKKIYHHVDAIIVHTAITKEELISGFNINHGKIHIIPHGVLKMDRNKKVIKKVKADFKKKYALENKVVFSLLGSINKYKGVDIVAKAWKSLNLSKNTNMHLIVAGSGNYNLLKPVEKDTSVTLINRFLTDDEFVALVHLSDYVMLPYRQISQSGVLLTALNEKKKVIVSNKGGLPEPFKFGDIGYIIDQLNEETLRSTITKASSQNHEKVDEKIWENIHIYYDWSNIGKLTYELYKHFL